MIQPIQVYEYVPKPSIKLPMWFILLCTNCPFVLKVKEQFIGVDSYVWYFF